MSTARTAIVIGGGPAGLLAAAHLAGAGVSTTLLEARAGFGGRAASEREGGFVLNQGPHALYVGGPAMRELRALGIDPPGWNPVSLRSVFIRNGATRRAPGGTAALARWIAAVARGKPCDELASISVNAWLEGSLDGATRDAAAALVRVTTFVADHDRLSADVAAEQIRIGLWPGVHYVRGGWQSLVDALAAASVRRGATLRGSARVRALEGAAGGWTVTLDAEQLRCGAVIVAAGGPEAAARLLGDRAPVATGPPVEISSLDIGLRRLPKPMRRFALGVDEPTYLSRHSAPDHGGPQLLSLMSYARGPLPALEAIADTVQPGWRDELLLHRHLPRMVASSALTSPQTGGLAGRPGVEVQPGLFVAGDWIGPEGWLSDASLASAAAAARAAAGAEAAPALAA